MAQVDPAAATNAFLNTAGFLRQGRQQDVENRRNALRDMYLGQQQEREATQFQQQQQQFSQQQQVENTRLLNMAAAEIAQDPAAMNRWGPRLEQSGVFSPNWRQMSPQEMQEGAKKVFEATSAALQAYGGATGASAPSSVQEWEYFNRLAPEDQRRYLEMKRSQQTFMTENQGVRTIVQPGTAGAPDRITPIGTLEGEARAAATIEGARTSAQESARTSAIPERKAAESQADAAADLPRVEGNADQMLDLLDTLENSNLSLIFGAASMLPVVPGTPQADAIAIWEQIQGKAFLEAFSTLKGGGQITEKEGEKATAAMTRLANRKQRPESAVEAIAELRSIVMNGVERARRKARRSSAQQEQTATGPNGQKLVLRNGQWVPL